MATYQQKEKWAAEVLALIESGTNYIATLVEKRRGASMSTYIGIKELEARGKIYRSGNFVWLVGRIRPF